ncbi:hypothetical protein E4T47_03202 [Aureobasidium subglaciale]|nr:hypothetical protein E4T47_03202 [Aureobasidium subglaciale]
MPGTLDPNVRCRGGNHQRGERSITNWSPLLSKGANRIPEQKERQNIHQQGFPRVLICRSTAHVWQSGRDAQFSADCGPSAIHGDRSLKIPCFCIHCELYPEIFYESVSCWSNDCAFSQLSVSRIRQITRTRVPPERLVIDK